MPYTANSDWRKLGDITPDQMRADMQKFNSPMLAELDAIYAAVKGMSALYAGHAYTEDKFGTMGVALQGGHNALGNMQPGSDHVPMTFKSWADGAAWWKAHVLDPKGPYAKATTLAQYIHVYAPRSDGNNEEEYVGVILGYANLGGGASPGGACPAPTTTTTTTSTTTAAPVPVPATPPLPDGIVWVGTQNFFPGRQGGQRPVAIVYHCTNDLNYASTESWFQDPSSQASAHFVITRDGVPHQFVSSTDAAWTNGDVRNPRDDIPWLNAAVRSGRNLNDYTIAYEFVATPDVPPTEEQYRTGIALSRYFCALYGISPHRGHQLRHSDINSVTRSYCPGDKFDLARIITALGGDPANMEG